MTPLKSLTFNAAQCRAEWNDFDALLKSKAVLNERKDVLPFFKAKSHLCTLITFYFPVIEQGDKYYNEFQIGDFVADLIVGDLSSEHYVVVEFEEGAPQGIFKKTGRKTSVWANRIEGAFSQLLDWLWALDDQRHTNDFTHTFGSSGARFLGLIVIGKDCVHSSQDKDRLRWRNRKIAVDSTAVTIVTFDDLRDQMDKWLKKYFGV